MAKPRVWRSRTGTRGRSEISGFIWNWRSAVGNANRRVLISIADLKSGRAPHPAHIANEFFTDARTHLGSGNAVLFNQRASVAVFLFFRMKFGRHCHVSNAD